jgi:WD40 repeat protein
VLRGHRAQLTDLVFSGDGQLLATSARDGDGRVWNLDTGRPVHVLRGHAGTVSAIALSPDRRWVATAGPISAGVWPMTTGRLLFYLRGDTAALTSVGFSPDGSTILSASADRTVRTFTCDVCVSRVGLVRLAEQRHAG